MDHIVDRLIVECGANPEKKERIRELLSLIYASGVSDGENQLGKFLSASASKQIKNFV